MLEGLGGQEIAASGGGQEAAKKESARGIMVIRREPLVARVRPGNAVTRGSSLAGQRGWSCDVAGASGWWVSRREPRNQWSQAARIMRITNADEFFPEVFAVQGVGRRNWAAAF